MVDKWGTAIYKEGMKNASNNSPEFIEEIEQIAFRNGLAAQVVIDKWRSYARRCSNYDQSPTLPEFIRGNSFA